MVSDHTPRVLSGGETTDKKLAIVGSGPAGLSAGLLAGRYGIRTTFFERHDIAGELVNKHSIETYPGFPDGISGPKLREDIVRLLREYDLEVSLTAVTGLEAGDEVSLDTEDGSVSTRAVILACGASYQPPNVPGADEYDG